LRAKITIVLLILVAALMPSVLADDGIDAASEIIGTGQGAGISVLYEYDEAVGAYLLTVTLDKRPSADISVTVMNESGDTSVIEPLPASTVTYIKMKQLDRGEYKILVTLANGGDKVADCSMRVTDCRIVTFMANGGTGTMDPVRIADGSYLELPACGFTAPSDMEFSSWEIDGKQYSVGDRVLVGSDTAVKAVWSGHPAKDPEFSVLIIAGAIAAVLVAIILVTLILRRRVN
jgi:hypothetical protein